MRLRTTAAGVLGCIGIAIAPGCTSDSTTSGQRAAASSDSLPTTKPVAGDLQLRPASLRDEVRVNASVSVVEGIVVEHLSAAVEAPFRTTSDTRTSCVIKIERTVAGPPVDQATVACSYPDRVVPDEERDAWNKAREAGQVESSDSDPAAVSLLPLQPWPVGTRGVFLVIPIEGPDGYVDTARALPVTLDDAASALTLSPGELTRPEYLGFDSPVTESVDSLLAENSAFIEGRPQREREIEDAVNAQLGD